MSKFLKRNDDTPPAVVPAGGSVNENNVAESPAEVTGGDEQKSETAELQKVFNFIQKNLRIGWYQLQIVNDICA